MTTMYVFKLTTETMINSLKLPRLNDRNWVHQFVTRLTGTSRVDSDILFDIDFHKDSIFFYLQTNKDIDLNECRSYGFTLEEKINIEQNLCNLNADDMIYIRMSTIPYRSNTNAKKHGGKGVNYIRNLNDRRLWFKEKLDKWGIELNEHSVIENSNSISFKKNGNNHLDAFTYECPAIVRDPEKFKEAVAKGIGKGKSYGLGLVMYAKVSA